jgi:hypothetical protein
MMNEQEECQISKSKWQIKPKRTISKPVLLIFGIDLEFELWNLTFVPRAGFL